jgi:3-hydroxyacyl-CoA dehydrogenase
MNEAEIRKVCVIGAGTMGGGIAAHLVNLGFEVTLLDASQEDVINGLDRLKQTRPPAFYIPERANDIRLGNVVEHLYLASEADWVCEAIVERLESKRTLFARLEPLLKLGALVSSNTSGIPLAAIAADRGAEFQSRFMGIHFFNPPRYVKLIELIPTESTDPEVVKSATEFLEWHVARRVIVAKDVPGFIANRYGMWCLFHAIHVAEKLGLAVEEVDAITGQFIGRPKSGTFRLADIIGLDVMRDIGNNLRASLPEDPQTATYELSNSMMSMLGRGWLGDKTGHGYYRREGKESLTLELTTFAYRVPHEPSLPDLERLGSLPLSKRLVESLTLKSEVGEYLREYLVPALRYADKLKAEVSQSVLDFDRVMKWGFGWELGPFEMIDLIGRGALGLPQEGSNYRNGEIRNYTGHYFKPPAEPEFETLSDFKEIAVGDTFRVRDLGNGVIGIVLTTKMGILSPHAINELTGVFQEKFEHFVFTSESKSFSAGFDIKFLNEAILAENFGSIESGLDALQRLGELMQAKSGAAAIFGHCLGAGLELALSCSSIVAAAETQIGLPESRLGLIPAGRGVALMKQNNSFNAKRLAEVTLTMAQGTVALNADAAKQLGYLRSTDRTVYNPDRLLFLAKQAALQAKPLDADIWKPALGPLGGMIDEGISKLRSAGTFSEYDEVIAGKLRQVVARSASYQDALQRERTEFLDLCHKNLTQTRIRHMVEHGTTLRN